MSLLRSAFLRHIAQTSTDPYGLEVSRAEGIFIFDKDGKPYIDCISGIAVSSLGHGHPRIIDAIKKQLDQHLHTQVYGEHIVAAQVAYAERLSQLLPESLSQTYFVNSGAEAVEGAMKLAKKYTGRYEIIACRNAYHGSTAGADSLRSDHDHTSYFRPLLPGIKHIQFNDERDLNKIDEHTAAVFIEPIQAEAGVIVPDTGYLKRVRDRCDEAGALMVLDEIQTGMGRTGALWRFEREDVVPDILLLAKSFGGGLPLGAFISGQEIMSVLSKDPSLGHMTTFGGNALCCASGLEALNIIVEENLSARSLQHEKNIREQLGHHPALREIRGSGLLLALDLHDPSKLPVAIKACRDEGLLVDWFLFNQSSVRLAPPLVMSKEETTVMCEKLIQALNSI